MAHFRARKLSEAAKVLATGQIEILTVALDAGYGSHEAFTRALAASSACCRLPPSALRAPLPPSP